MPLTRNWATQSINNTLDTSSVNNWHKAVVLAAHNFITGVFPAAAAGAWTVDLSSNGTTSGSGNHISSTADLVWDIDGNAHSWAVYKSPAGYVPNGAFVYILMSLGGDTNTHSIRWKCSGAAFTGGSNTADPTNPNTLTRVSTSDSPFVWQSDSVGATSSWHGTRNTSGDFVFMVSKTGTGFPITQVSAFSTLNAQALDPYPFMLSASKNEVSPGCFANDASFDSSNNNCAMLWNGGQRHPGGEGNSGSVQIPRTPSAAASILISGLFQTDAFSGKVIDWPAHVWSNNYAASNQSAYRGRLPDIDVGSLALAQGSGEPSSAQVRCLIGQFWFPFSTTPTF